MGVMIVLPCDYAAHCEMAHLSYMAAFHVLIVPVQKSSLEGKETHTWCKYKRDHNGHTCRMLGGDFIGQTW